MSEWTFNGVAVDPNSIPSFLVGFVYKITRKSDGKFYFGKKLFWSHKWSVKTVVNKKGEKVKKRKKIIIPSDWQTYWSSSPELQKDVRDLGESAFTREIVCVCVSKGSLSYYELKYQMEYRVLEPDVNSYNGIIQVRIHHSHLKAPLWSIEQ